MRTALNEHNEQILAGSRNKQFEYTCIGCGNDAILAAGQKNVPHFRHRVLSSCDYSNKANSDNSMSAFHRDIQTAFHEAGAELEKRYPNNRADVYYNGYVYEIQNSPIEYAKVVQRNEAYGKVRWIVNAQTLGHTSFDTDKLVFMVDNSSQTIEVYYKKARFQYNYKTYEDLVGIVSNNANLKVDVNAALLKAEVEAEKMLRDFERGIELQARIKAERLERLEQQRLSAIIWEANRVEKERLAAIQFEKDRPILEKMEAESQARRVRDTQVFFSGSLTDDEANTLRDLE